MKCYVHLEKDAIGTCVGCGKPICEECKVEVQGKNYCKRCAGELAMQVREPQRTSGFAVASLVLGIFAILSAWSGAGSVACGILAVIFGSVARKKIKASKGTLGGRGMATAGLILGWILLVIGIIIIITFGSFMGYIFQDVVLKEI